MDGDGRAAPLAFREKSSEAAGAAGTMWPPQPRGKSLRSGGGGSGSLEGPIPIPGPPAGGADAQQGALIAQAQVPNKRSDIWRLYFPQTAHFHVLPAAHLSRPPPQIEMLKCLTFTFTAMTFDTCAGEELLSDGEMMAPSDKSGFRNESSNSRGRKPAQVFEGLSPQLWWFTLAGV